MQAINLHTGFLNEASIVKSPHFNARPTKEISLLVIHGISLPAGQFGGPYIDDLFLGHLDPKADPSFESVASLEVSSHLLINRAGEIKQYVSFLNRAWHAGLSEWQDRTNCNDFSIGIELEGTDDTPYAEAQYQALLSVSKIIMQAFPAITSDRLVRHSDIAPGRKTDPGSAFQWDAFLKALREGDESL